MAKDVLCVAVALLFKCSARTVSLGTLVCVFVYALSYICCVLLLSMVKLPIRCQKQFKVTPQPDWIRIQYGGKNITVASNIVFSYSLCSTSVPNLINAEHYSNGMMDPWSGGAVLESLSVHWWLFWYQNTCTSPWFASCWPSRPRKKIPTLRLLVSRSELS